MSFVAMSTFVGESEICATEKSIPFNTEPEVVMFEMEPAADDKGENLGPVLKMDLPRGDLKS
jgi:hypothetical protein